MPRLDNTGPQGNGPNTGRGLGQCNPNAQTGNGGGGGRRNGGGNGGGKGRRCVQGSNYSKVNNGQQNDSLLSQVLAEIKHLTNRVLNLEKK